MRWAGRGASRRDDPPDGRAGGAADDYWVLTVVLDPAEAAPDAASEALANFLWEAGALGVVEETVAGGTSLCAYFPPGAAAARLAARVRQYARDQAALGAPVGPGGVSVAPLAPAPWAEAWRAHFRPLAVGRRLCVSPPWERPADSLVAGREVVWIEPGRAFGTGDHPTTRGCLELLERALEWKPAARALDVGTGSGILALAALRLGVREAWAIDPDPDATAAALENAGRNDMAERLRVGTTALEDWSGAPADLVLANLLAAAHVAHARPLARAVEAGGQLVAGGLLVHEVPAVVGALAPHGLWLVEVVEHEGWASVAFGRTP